MKYHIAIKNPGVVVSPPSRGAWIEISGSCVGSGGPGVAPLAGGVD